MNNYILIHGATGVGKSALVSSKIPDFPLEIINCDIGSFYEPFTIGTAKPDWRNQPLPHHLFDIITEPQDFSVIQYREMIIKKMKQVWDRGAIPVLVGGSGFYGKSLFFPPQGPPANWDSTEPQGTWQELNELDPARAKALEKNDIYRIARALSIIKQGKKASECVPTYEPLPGRGLIVFLTRERQELYQRINARTEQMFNQGWVEETKKVIGSPWEKFLERKKLIGYTDILQYIKEGNFSEQALQKLQTTIAKKTRHYAKRQETFWRMFKRLLKEHGHIPKTINLSDDAQYEQLTKEIVHFLRKK